MSDAVVNVLIQAQVAQAEADIQAVGASITDLAAASGLAGRELETFQRSITMLTGDGVNLQEALVGIIKTNDFFSASVREGAANVLEMVRAEEAQAAAAMKAAAAQTELAAVTSIGTGAATSAAVPAAAISGAAGYDLSSSLAIIVAQAEQIQSARIAAVAERELSISMQQAASAAAMEAMAFEALGITEAEAAAEARQAAIASAIETEAVEALGAQEVIAAGKTEVHTRSILDLIKAMAAQTGAALESAAALISSGASSLAAGTNVADMDANLQRAGTRFVSAGAGAGAFASILGIGVVTALGMAVEKAEKQELALGRLSIATGASAVELAQLKLAMEGLGAPGDKLDMALQRIAKTMQSATDPASAQARAFHALGVSTEGWSESLPPLLSIFPQLAAHLQNSKKETQDMAEAQVIGGRNVKDLIAVLKQGPEALDAYMQKNRALAEQMAGNIDAARQLRQVELDFQHTLTEVAIGAIPIVTKGLQGLETVFRVLWGVTQDFSTGLLLGFHTIADSAVTLGVTIKDMATGNFAKAKSDFATGFDAIKKEWSSAHDQMQRDDASMWKKVHDIWQKPIKGPGATGETDTDVEPKRKKSRDGSDEEITGAIAHDARMAELARKSVEDQLNIQKAGDEQRIQGIENVYDREVQQAQEAVALAQKKVIAEDLVNRTELANTLRLLGQKKAAIDANDPSSGDKRQKILNEELKAEDEYGKQSQKLASELSVARERLAVVEAAVGRKMADDMAKGAEELDKKILESTTQRVQKQIELDKKKSEDHLKALDIDTKSEEAHDKALLEMQRKMIEEQYNAGAIGKGKELELLQATFDKEYDMEKDLVNKEILLEKLKPNSEAAVSDLNKKLLQLQDTYNGRRLAGAIAAADAERAVYNQFLGSVSRAFETSIQGVVQGTQTLRQAWAKMGQSILIEWLGTLIQIEMKNLQALLIMKLQHIGFSNVLRALHLIDIGEHAGATAAKVATSVKGDIAEAASAKVKAGAVIAAKTSETGASAIEGAAARSTEIIGNAAVAFSAAYAATAAIPIIGPLLAPGAAALAAADVLAVLPAASAAQGGIFASDTITQVHAKEMVLPPHLSTGLQEMLADPASFAFGRGGGGPALGGGFGGAGSQPAGVTLNYHESPGGRGGGAGRSHARDIVAELRSAIRDNRLYR